jgi:hypothetical protein
MGFGATLANLLGTRKPFALTAGVSHAGGKNTVARSVSRESSEPAITPQIMCLLAASLHSSGQSGH